MAANSQRVLVCPDAHHPYVDRAAWHIFLEAARELCPDILVIIGDFADCYSVSQHRKDPTRRADLKYEIESVNAALYEIESLKIPRVIYCEGNHEWRLARYLQDNAPELWGLVDLRSLLRIRDRGWEWVDYRSHVQIGRAYFTHDVGRSGANATAQSLTDFGHPLVIGHSHRLGVAYRGTVAGDRHVAMSVGWLGDYESIDYMHRDMARRDWQHGFGVVDVAPDGLVWMQAVPIVNGRWHA